MATKPTEKASLPSGQNVISMDAFTLHGKLIEDYSKYVRSFLRIRDERIVDFVDSYLKKGILWPEPLIQLSPSYEPGPTAQELVRQGTLHPLCADIFRLADQSGKLKPLHRHQHEAILAASRKEHYLLTTGTGSGKSLTYFIPIVDWVLKNNPGEGKVRALVVYPMNALINSQEQALKDFFGNLPGGSPVTFARYTGQETEEEKRKTRESPPHILLTNYVMLELVMTRPEERGFVERTLTDIHFLVLDELHTYRGRQGSDVAMLVRRLRERCGNQDLLCIGTSATMAVGQSRKEKKAAAAEAASKIFGVPLKPENVIDETLRRSLPEREFQAEELRRILQQDKLSIKSFKELAENPLASWVENTFGVVEEEGFLVRRPPITLHDGAEMLSQQTGIPKERCLQKLREIFQVGSQTLSEYQSPAFAFKLHQFISQGGTVHASIEKKETRYLTLDGEYYAPETDGKRLLFPLVFCRDCGQEYYVVELGEKEVLPGSPLSYDEEDGATKGYLLLDDREEPIWSESNLEDLPDEWLEFKKGQPKVKSEYRDHLPRDIYVTSDGMISDSPDEEGELCWFIPSPFLTCLYCGAVYTKREREFTKLTRLSSEGRSTSTTLLSLSALCRMNEEAALEQEARKLLSFTDNRQDASLQAGHFNDFVAVALLRSAIYKALKGPSVAEGFNHSNVAEKVMEALDLDQEEYAREVGIHGPLPSRNKAALREYLEYRIFEDLKRGWRIIQPNLEQCGLLRIDYEGLADLCSDPDPWKGHPLLKDATPDVRERNI